MSKDNPLAQLRLGIMSKAFKRALDPQDPFSFDQMKDLRHQLAQQAKVLKVPDEHRKILSVVSMIETNSGAPQNFRQRESQGMAVQMLATATAPRFMN